MDNYIPDFNNFVIYLKDLIENTTIALQQSNLISDDPIEFEIFSNYGEFKEKREVLVDEQNTPIVVCVRNMGGSIDNTAGIKTYLQSVDLEILAPLDLKDTVSYIFNTIVLENSKKTVTIDEKPTYILMSDLPEYSEGWESIQCVDRIQLNIPISFIIYPNSVLADNVKLMFNGVELKVRRFSVSVKDELKADNKFGYSDARARFIYNTTGFVLQIEFLYDKTNSVCQTLYNNAWTNSNAGQPFTFKKIENGDEDNAIELTLIHESTVITGNIGSLISLQSQFYLASFVSSSAVEE